MLGPTCVRIQLQCGKDTAWVDWSAKSLTHLKQLYIAGMLIVVLVARLNCAHINHPEHAPKPVNDYMPHDEAEFACPHQMIQNNG